MNRKYATCPFCEEQYEMGFTGTIYGCDKCQGIVRDDDEYFYELHEDQIELFDVRTEETTTRQRPRHQ